MASAAPCVLFVPRNSSHGCSLKRRPPVGATHSRRMAGRPPLETEQSHHVSRLGPRPTHFSFFFSFKVSRPRVKPACLQLSLFWSLYVSSPISPLHPGQLSLSGGPRRNATRAREALTQQAPWLWRLRSGYLEVAANSSKAPRSKCRVTSFSFAPLSHARRSADTQVLQSCRRPAARHSLQLRVDKRRGFL